MPPIDTMQDKVIERAVKQFKARKPLYRLTQDYYEGEHRLAFATEKFRTNFGKLFKEFADNLCPAVVDAAADKLTLVGFGVEEGEKSAADAAWKIWKANRMDKGADEVHQEALTNGDAYVIVWPDNDNVIRLYPQIADCVTVKYDEENPKWIQWAAKVWLTDDDRIRLTLYYPDRIEKYITPPGKKVISAIPEKFGDFIRYDVGDENWPLENPHGQVPVFHFANRARTGKFGRSELKDVIPLQDALNKTVMDGLIAGEFLGFPQRWATGLDVDTDPDTGLPKVPFKAAIDRLWTTGDDKVNFGQFEAADIEKYDKTAENKRLEIARVSGTPGHYIVPNSGDWPSGEALKTAEARFTSKMVKKQLSYGNVWEDVLRLALKMQGNTSEFRLTALWKDPAPRSEKEFWESAPLKQDAGVPKSQVQREYGYSEEEIEKFKAEKADEAQAGAEVMATAFDRGRVDMGQQ